MNKMNVRPRRPKRQKKADRILHSGQTKDQIVCDYAIAPTDQKAREMEEKWGIDVLPELVSVETAMKFGSAMAKMNAAIDANDPEECKIRAEVVLRGWDAMDAEAERMGAQRASTDIWEFEIDDKPFALMKDGRSWQKIKKDRPDLELLTIREVILAYRFLRENELGIFEKSVKKSFPGAEMIDLEGKSFDDPIPF